MARFDMGLFYENMISLHLPVAVPLGASVPVPLRVPAAVPVAVPAAVPTALDTLSNSLAPGVSDATVVQLVSDVLRDQSPNTLESIFVLLFQTRDIRGMGLRDTSMAMWTTLLQNKDTQALTLDLLDLIPEYGCWQDIFKMPHVAWSRMLDIVHAQICSDEVNMTEGGKVSLLAKWMPREGQPMASYCASRLVPGQMLTGTRMKLYRKRITRLNKYLNTVEINMCANKWDHIEPAKVPNKAMKKYKKAFLNELVKKECLRYPNSEARMACREHFQQYVFNIQPTVNMDTRYDLVRERVKAFMDT